MTQRIFDVENEKDIADLWDIVPDKITKITKPEIKGLPCFSGYDSMRTSDLININWHDKTEITRPIQEATEDDVGKLCKFWDDDDIDYSKQIGLLTGITTKKCIFKYILDGIICFPHCRRLTKQEIEELI